MKQTSITNVQADLGVAKASPSTWSACEKKTHTE